MAKNRTVGFRRWVACRQRFHRSTQVAAFSLPSRCWLRLFPRPETRSGSNPGGYLLLALVPPVQIVTAMSFHFAPSAPSLCLQPQVSFIKLNISPHTTGRFESKTCALDTTIRAARPRPLDTLYVFISVAFVSIRSTRGWPVEHPARRIPWPVPGSNFHQ